MRLPDDARHTRFGRGFLTVFLVAGLSACSMVGDRANGPRIASAGNLPAANGPGADYPVIIGQPYSVAGVEYTPSDALNVDQVGYVTRDADATGYTGAHHTLPLPSYAEITSLETGRTILVRLERRGPMTSNHVVALSPAALVQLGADAEHPVRVRRVNPPEDHRAMLRSGNAAPLRMDTPSSLLSVLQRRLPASGVASLRAENIVEPQVQSVETVEIAASEVAAELPDAASPVSVPVMNDETPLDPAPEYADLASGEQSFADAFRETHEQVTQPARQPEVEGGFLVQAAAFANQDNARRAAQTLGAEISQSGRFYRVRTGPFATRGEAEASLAIVQRAGYSDARILTGG